MAERPTTAAAKASSTKPASNASWFPKSLELVVTTNKHVYSWTAAGVADLFRSGSAGILVARRVGSDGHLLAVADAEVVILHDTRQKADKSYRLKRADVLGHCILQPLPPSFPPRARALSRELADA
jgi:hypothetical protein